MCDIITLGVDFMDKAKIVNLLASVLFLIGAVISIVELFIEVHKAISISATVLMLVSLVLWFVVVKCLKNKK